MRECAKAKNHPGPAFAIKLMGQPEFCTTPAGGMAGQFIRANLPCAHHLLVSPSPRRCVREDSHEANCQLAWPKLAGPIQQLQHVSCCGLTCTHTRLDWLPCATPFGRSLQRQQRQEQGELGHAAMSPDMAGCSK